MQQMTPTKRNYLLGLLADATEGVSDWFGTSTNPLEDTGTDYSIGGLLAETTRPVARTLDLLSYGEPLMTGRGQTLMLKPEVRDTALMFAPGGPVAKRGAVVAGRELAPKAGQMAEDYLRGIGGVKDVIEQRNIGQIGFDKRFDPRKKELERLNNLTTVVDNRLEAPPIVSLLDFEGKPFITSMSDRTDGGALLQAINGVELDRPVDLRGGQNFMFDDPNMVWASAKGPTNQIKKLAGILKKETGENPLYIPWTMAPTGGDFATMTGETMINYASKALPKKTKKEFDNMVKQYIPDWKGVDSPESVIQFRSAKDKVRKALKNKMDVNFRDAGGLSRGEARLAVSDPNQLTSPDGSIYNIGVIDPSRSVSASTHPSYPYGVFGEGLGRVAQDEPVNIFQMLPNLAQDRGLLDLTSPRKTDLRALQMKPYGGIITDKLLKSMGY